MKTKRFYLVDDDPIYLYTCIRKLKEFGLGDCYEVFEDAELALNALENSLNKMEGLPEIILLDLNMPVMDGWEFLEVLEQRKEEALQHLKIFIVSSSTSQEDLEKVNRYKLVKKYFLKPISDVDFKRTLLSA